MATALFINGIYEWVLTNILNSQLSRGGGDSYLQPHSGLVIRILRDQHPTIHSPIRLYASTTKTLNHICYSGLIVGWDDKREMAQRKRNAVRRHLEKYDPGELDLLMGDDTRGQLSVNLITVRDLKKLDTLHTTALLRKVSDGLPMNQRTRAGGWSEVYDLGDLIDLPTDTLERYSGDLTKAVEESSKLSDSVLKKRLASATNLPARIQIISVGFKRNPDVIVAVLRRANGLCEKCRVPAPFVRRSDNSPYLEVHHWIPLSRGGEDSIQNAAALCPNCHRQLHHGPNTSES